MIKKLKKINRGDEQDIEKVTRQFHKRENGIIVSGGICKDGLGKLIFHSDNVNSFAYKQVLNFYREDLNNYPGKYFQQDEAHSPKNFRKVINNLFGHNFIPTWENWPKKWSKYP